MSQDTAPLILSENLMGLRSQALGLTEAAGLNAEFRPLTPAPPWSWFPARFWPRPLSVVAEALPSPLPDLIFGCGGMAGAILAALRDPGHRVVQIQNPRMDIRRFDLIVANEHDELTGPNVIVTRTALHRVTPTRLAEEADRWGERFAHLPRPLVSVLLGGNNGRYRLDLAVAGRLAADLAKLVKAGAGVMVTPSRRTDPAVTALIAEALKPLGGWVWDFTGDNPYFAMLSLADLILVTQDSVSMISEAAATTAPVMFVPLPGRSRRQGLFIKTMQGTGRVRPFEGQFTQWPVTPLDDTPLAAHEMRRRLGL